MKPSSPVDESQAPRSVETFDRSRAHEGSLGLRHGLQKAFPGKMSISSGVTFCSRALRERSLLSVRNQPSDSCVVLRKAGKLAVELNKHTSSGSGVAAPNLHSLRTGASASIRGALALVSFKRQTSPGWSVYSLPGHPNAKKTSRILSPKCRITRFAVILLLGSQPPRVPRTGITKVILSILWSRCAISKISSSLAVLRSICQLYIS